MARGQEAMGLIMTMNHATSEICSAFLAVEESTSTFHGLLEAFERHGLPLSLYNALGSHHFHADRAWRHACPIAQPK